MYKFKIILTTGLAMFAMFFGSGNLVFPIKLGIDSGSQYPIASLGLILTGVVVPFLGLISMIFYQGDRNRYFGLLGRWAPLTLSLLILSLLGPFGVVPRCIIVAYGGISLIWPEIPLILFSAVFSVTIILIIWHKSKLVPIIGKILGPFKIGGIIIIIIAAVSQSPYLVDTVIVENPLSIGLFQGYQTMDLLAAYFFSITIMEYLRSINSNREEVLKTSLAASVVGASLISIVYLGFVTLGAYYASYLVDKGPEQYLAVIATLTLGKNAAIIVAVTMFLACLTTAATLSKLFAELLYHDLVKERISWPLSIIITIIISFLLSLIGFTAISQVLGMILEYIYPALIALSVSSILKQYMDFIPVKLIFWGTIVMSVALELILH